MHTHQSHISGNQLADILNDKLTVSNGSPTRNPTVEEVEEPKPPTVYSISQHYTHTAHITQSFSLQQPSSKDIASQRLLDSGISPSTLLPSQLELFEQVREEQRSRLIELWRAFPPDYACHEGQALAGMLGEYQSTSMGQEEKLAWLRSQEKLSMADVLHNLRDFCEMTAQPPRYLVDQNCAPTVEQSTSQRESFPSTFMKETMEDVDMCDN
ncbi:hypothetical protein ACLMJK_005890 [Lecanora helva]